MRTAAKTLPSLILICTSYPLIGGSELEARRVSAALIRRGYRITVVCVGGDPMPPVRDWIDPEGIPVRVYAGRWNGTLQNIVFALRLAAMLLWEHRNYQLVYFLMGGLHLAVGLPIARFLRKPILMKIGGSGVIPLMAESLSGRLELKFLRSWAYRVMILNEGMREEAIRERFAPEKLYWMPNPVDTDVFAPCDDVERVKLRTEFGISSEAFVVLYVGRLAAEKALPTLLDAFSRVVRRLPAAMLVLVGNGPLRSSLAEQAAQLGLREGNIRFAGFAEPAKVPAWLRIADIFTLVSYSEGFACALLEAMSTGLPSVVSDIIANRQLIEAGHHGLLTPVGDPDAIATAILALLENPPLRTTMGKAARQRALENYAIAKVADRYESLIRHALADVR